MSKFDEIVTLSKEGEETITYSLTGEGDDYLIQGDDFGTLDISNSETADDIFYQLVTNKENQGYKATYN